MNIWQTDFGPIVFYYHIVQKVKIEENFWRFVYFFNKAKRAGKYWREIQNKVNVPQPLSLCWDMAYLMQLFSIVSKVSLRLRKIKKAFLPTFSHWPWDSELFLKRKLLTFSFLIPDWAGGGREVAVNFDRQPKQEKENLSQGRPNDNVRKLTNAFGKAISFEWDFLRRTLGLLSTAQPHGNSLS